MTSFTAVFVIWGDLFGAGHINALVRDIAAGTAAEVDFVCFTDRDRPDLDARCRAVPIPSPFDEPRLLKGTRAKLGQFVPGVIDPAKPAVFFDLDTIVLGDAARLAAVAAAEGGLTMLPATFGPVYRLHKAIHRVTGGRMRGRINGSVYAYRPEEMADLPERFLADIAAAGDPPPRWMTGHDRWLSVRAADRIRIWDPTLAAKFGDVFAHPLGPREPAARADRLVAMTFPDVPMGPEGLLAADDGARLADGKGRRMVWSDAATGGWKTRIRDHWAAIYEE